MTMNNPTGEQLRQLKESGKQGPFVMVNLLNFRARGREDDETGRQSYERYAQAVGPLLKKVGARLLWMGDVDQVFIGRQGDSFDRVMLVEYPSRAAFLEMVSSPEYLRANQDRESGLERTVLLAADPLFSRMDKPEG